MTSSHTPSWLSLIHSGLPPAAAPKKVIVVGAGVAGLVAAYELQRAGHEPLILEAQHRVGGRVYTLRESFSHGMYAEAGAMRIPRAHELTMAYVDKFKLSVSPFTMGNPMAYYHLRGQRRRIAEANAEPDALGYERAKRERGKTAGQPWEEALRPIVQKLEEQGEAA